MKMYVRFCGKHSNCNLAWHDISKIIEKKRNVPLNLKFKSEDIHSISRAKCKSCFFLFSEKRRRSNLVLELLWDVTLNLRWKISPYVSTFMAWNSCVKFVCKRAFFQTPYPGAVGVLSSLRTITSAHVIFCQQKKQLDNGVVTGAKISGPISKFSPCSPPFSLLTSD